MVHMQQVARDLQKYFGPDVPRHTLHLTELDVTLVTDYREMCAVLSKFLVYPHCARAQVQTYSDTLRKSQQAHDQVQTYLVEWANKDLKQPLAVCMMLLRDRDHH